MTRAKLLTAHKKAKKHPRAAHYEKQYGLNPIAAREAAHALATGQKSCAICRRRRATVLDHNHATGLPRGFLCTRCNLGLGAFLDDPGLLDLARQYLHTTRRRPFPGMRMEPIVLPPAVVGRFM